MTRVLLIEDEDLVRDTVKQILEREGFDVDVAADGAEGLRSQALRPAELVITDIIMPNKDGVEVTIEMKAKHPQTKVLAVSGGGRVRNLNFLEHARSMGADAALAKPFTREELIAAVHEALGLEASE